MSVAYSEQIRDYAIAGAGSDVSVHNFRGYSVRAPFLGMVLPEEIMNTA